MLGEIAADLAQGGIVTLEIAAGAWFISALLGLLLAIPPELGLVAIRKSLASVLLVLRSAPQLVVLYLIYFGLGATGIELNSVLAAILALGITDAAFTAEYYRAGFMTVPWAQREAGKSLGLSQLSVFRRVVLPQVIPFVVPPLLNAFVGMLKTATLAAAVGAPEILYRGQNDMNRTGRIVFVMIIIIGMYVIATMPLTRLVSHLEHRVRSRASS
jgi:His/Glu/Gln/Arg/opine family amino acid ABC transporter permease subunit